LEELAEASLSISLKKNSMSFYQCQKCKRSWAYPIKECIFCFEPLIKMQSNQMKVIACSRVSIPTLLHPIVPYYALIIEDENGYRYAHKSMTEKNIGEEINYTSNENAVAIWRNKYDFTETIEKVISLTSSIKENSKILILPTLISPNHPYLRENTSPEFLDAILSIILQKTKDVKIVGQSFNDVPVELSAQKSGLLDICLKYGITPIDLGKTNFVKQNKIEVSEEALNADLILNIPIMKIGKSSATENIFKLVSKTNYSSLKYLDSEQTITDGLNELFLNKTFTIAEADVVQGKDTFNRYLGLVLAGKNYLNLDSVFDEITINKKTNNIPTVGREIKEVQHNAELL
jgi:hypothetical protein